MNLIKPKMLYTNAKHVSALSKHLSFEENELEITVDISDSLIQLLQDVITSEQYEQQPDEKIIKIKIFSGQSKPIKHNQLGTSTTCNKFHCKVTDVQAVLALAVVLQCYPLEWQYVFFWDAWLAITIQLGLLRETRATEKIINTTKVTVIENEVFPCQWLTLEILNIKTARTIDR